MSAIDSVRRFFSKPVAVGVAAALVAVAVGSALAITITPAPSALAQMLNPRNH